MKISALLLSSAVLLGFSVPALADEAASGAFYGRLSGGAVVVDDVDSNVGGAPVSVSFDTGWTVSGALGYRLTDWLALEGEVTYLDVGLDEGKAFGTSVKLDGDLTSVIGLVNVNLHPLKTGSFDPFIGGGIGAAYSDISIDRIGGLPVSDASDSSTDLAAQGTVGLNYAVNAGTSIGAQYRYLWIDSGEDGTDDVTAHNFTIAVTFNF